MNNEDTDRTQTRQITWERIWYGLVVGIAWYVLEQHTGVIERDTSFFVLLPVLVSVFLLGDFVIYKWETRKKKEG